jgi:uncharacterized protein YcfJ
MTKYLAGVLSVIAAGVLLIAYGLLSPRTAAFADDPRFARPMLASDRAMYVDQFGQPQFAQPAPFNYPAYSAAYPQYAPPAQVAQPVRTVASAPVRQASSTQRVVERAPKRDWKKTALVIGGSTAAGAGVGALVGGKKGALIGAAVGGGASTIYESTKR